MNNKPTDLQQRLESGKRVLLAEISPPAEAAPAGVQQLAKRFAGKVHALGISDNRDRVGMAALAAASLVAGQGVEPILHVTTRDRNRIALVSEVLGAHALGIRNILCTSGTHQTLGHFRAAKNVYDIDVIQLLQTCANLASDASLVGEGAIAGADGFCLGAVASPNADPLELQMIRLGKKVSAGAGFLVSQPVYDLERFNAWWAEVSRRGLHEKVAILAGIEPLGEARVGTRPGEAAARSCRGSRMRCSSKSPRRPTPRPAAARRSTWPSRPSSNSAGPRGSAAFPSASTAIRTPPWKSSRNPDWGRTSRACQVRHPYQACRAGDSRTVGKLGIVDWREDCSSCHNCVKRGCVYGFYRDEADTLRDEIGYLDYIYQCKGCLSCVQDCTKNILTRVVNPEFKRLGDSYYTPEIILSTWFQAETGRIPVSGSGYGGPFSGPGFDSMWTDMSEIVRPTRDGIHGREYISTSVDIGRKLPYLAFRDGQLAVASPPLLELPMPVIFDVVPQHWRRGPVLESIAAAAAELGTMAVIAAGDGDRLWGEAARRGTSFRCLDARQSLMRRSRGA